MKPRIKLYIGLAVIIVITLVLGWFDAPYGPNIDLNKIGFSPQPGESESSLVKRMDVKLGLDLRGGAEFLYAADLSNIAPEEHEEAMIGIRNVVERRVNAFGVSEPVVYVQSGDRLVVELAGVSNLEEAKAEIGQTPTLVFMVESEQQAEIPELTDEEGNPIESEFTDENGNPIDLSSIIQPQFEPTELTGSHLSKAEVVFSQMGVQTPEISLEFDDEGKQLFAELTEANIGKRIAIAVDGVIVSAPNVNERITGGKAVITGTFTIDEAKELARNLNAGALPVPIELVHEQEVGATLGKISIQRSLIAGLVGLIFIALFVIFYYRLPGVLAILALISYAVIVLFMFKLIPVTLTLAGVAGFILSVGMAVDANVLIFECMKEELRRGRDIVMAVDLGFKGAWSSIRDSNISTLITCTILYISNISMVQGFALTLGIGVVVSMISAIGITRVYLKLVAKPGMNKSLWWFGGK